MIDPIHPDAPRKHLTVYSVSDRKDGRSFWSRIGAAFPKADGSIQLLMDAWPIAGNRIFIREPRPWDPGRAANGAAGDEGEAQP